MRITRKKESRGRATDRPTRSRRNSSRHEKHEMFYRFVLFLLKKKKSKRTSNWVYRKTFQGNIPRYKLNINGKYDDFLLILSRDIFFVC